MHTRVGTAVALAVLLLGSACGHLKEFAPIRYSTIYPRIPNQQRLIAQPAREAAEKACAAVNLSQYAGKTARVEVTGVFPHSETELLDFIASVVEAEAARAGIAVLQRPDPRFAPDHVIIAHHGSGPPQLPLPAQPVDLRLVASVDWGGIDLKDQQYIKAWPLAGQIALGALSLLTGIGATAAIGDDDLMPVTLGIPMLGIASAIIWAVLDPSEGHVFTMQGRVRVTLAGIPQSAGLAAVSGFGEGESSVVVDPESHTGYSMILNLPRESSEGQRRQAR